MLALFLLPFLQLPPGELLMLLYCYGYFWDGRRLRHIIRTYDASTSVSARLSVAGVSECASHMHMQMLMLTACSEC